MNELILQKLDAGVITRSGLAMATAIGSASAAGTALADDTTAVVLVNSDFGKTFTCALDGAAKTVTLPVSVTANDIGKSLKIYQTASLVGSGVLTLVTGTGNVLAANSAFVGTGVTVFRPDDAVATTIVITGAATNSAFGAGSTITATVVGEGLYMVEILCTPLGAGNDAVAVS
tara:strand:+ start:373 stop:894 length:522 start_codon:yes stop_codon:yes gene_type:complete